MAQSVSEPQAQPRGSFKRGRMPRKALLLIPGIVLIAGGLAIWQLSPRSPATELMLSGRIEGYETEIGTKVAGRIEEVTVREGASVQVGQILARLDDAEIQAQVDGAEARLQAARQQAENARLQLSVVESQIAETQFRLQQSEGDTSGRVAQAEAEVAAAEAQLRQAEAQVTEAEAQLNLAQVERDRFAQLVQDGAIAQQQLDQAEATLQTAQALLTSRIATVEAAQRRVTAATGILTQSQTTRLNPDITLTQLDRLNTQREQAQTQLAAAQAEVSNAAADRQRIQSQFNNLTITSPIAGVVTVRTVEPGVVVSPGRTLLSVLDLDTVYLRGFIPAGEIGRVRVGQAARVYLDSDPDRPLAASVTAIDAEASFTPENIYFREDRVQQVFGVRLAIENPAGFAKPGMPADGEIVLGSEE
ncbi:HlyD family secretion protein [Egbenema bharatensis]|uniref:HlyD family secretion protein n=1 Tax=Egbenema bharatensis TaxID=3463334 RepID=UPI003A874BF6